MRHKHFVLSFVSVVLLILNAAFPQKVLCEIEKRVAKNDGDGHSSPSYTLREQVSLHTSGLILKLKRHIRQTKIIIDGIVSKYSKRGTVNDDIPKDNITSRTVNETGGNLEVLQEPRPNMTELNSMYEKAKQILNSSHGKKREEAYDLLVKAGGFGHNQSRLEVAWNILFGEFSGNILEAKAAIVELADLGDPGGHMALGFLHSAGLVEHSDQARALVHYMLGAMGGDLWAQIVLGYRYKNGISVTKNCELSLQYYEAAAKMVADRVSLTGGTLVHRVRIIDLEENGNHNSYLLEPDLLQYYEYLAAKGDTNAQITLGQLYYHGLRGCPKDVRKAKYYFAMALVKENPTAMGYMGRIYLENSETVSADNTTAFNYFKQAADKNNPIGLSGLGLMFLEGRGVEVNLPKAKSFFARAADLGWVEGQLHLGVLYLNGLGVKQNYRSALKYFHLAAQSGHILAYYYLGQMHAQGIGILRSCPTAVELYKSVVERGKWNEFLITGINKYQAGDYAHSFLVYAFLAELGYEVAQSNAAYMLEKGLSGLNHISEDERYFRAFNYWRRAAQQGFAPAHVKIGDYYFYGRGVPLDYEAAASEYRLASSQYSNAQALFNIAYMHEQGLGMPKDVALAKRFYDLAAAVSPDAYAPVCLALVKLAFIMALEYLFFKSPPRYESLWDIFWSPPWDVYAIFFLILSLWLLIGRRT